tara:strand:- start:1721 stop:2308 length:588 start_codon:yes stop_codon:yes gene_type:complete
MYKKYFQKSKVFLYPLLGIKKGNDFVPVETFLSWNGQYDVKKKLFFCLYDQKETDEWHKFENLYLLQNSLFHDYVLLDKNLHLYIFDLKKYSSDYNNLCKGDYSEFADKTKTEIINFFGEKGSLAQYMEEYLYPEFYHDQYAEDLNVNLDIMLDVWELCDKPDFIKEELTYKKPDQKKVFKNKLISLYMKSKTIL